MYLKNIIAVVSLLFIAACSQESAPDTSAASDAMKDAASSAADMADGARADAATYAGEAIVAARVANADAAKGKRIYIFCQACHTVNAGGDNKLGPNLNGIVGKAAAQVPGFIYSDALQGAGLTWDAATLDKWIARPAELVPGTTMIFAGVSDPQQRAQLIAYLQSVETTE